MSSQFLPAKSGGHLHENVSSWFSHVPSFSQGEESHGFGFDFLYSAKKIHVLMIQLLSNEQSLTSH